MAQSTLLQPITGPENIVRLKVYSTDPDGLRPDRGWSGWNYVASTRRPSAMLKVRRTKG